ncbi:DUF2167 domain-containing protein [Flammeovirgaceae bacterium SG7u.111]|nr:DUF2167 domain-containing protein [Flammeovirgaceae bacterium SG7u.132]WPO36523.1 DUF2167 domain-containing protein [Flammeovirgaceae bacterium SG7u.111]
MKNISILILCLFMSKATFALYDSTEVVDMEAYQHIVDSINDSFNYEYGTVELDGGIATLTVPEGYKFLGAEQSNFVLTDLWGNPPSEVLGLLFPKETLPIGGDLTYAVEITYSEEGYIEDEDAEDIDYEALLEEMQSDMEEVNPVRVEQGYAPITLVGWASAPFYDKENKKLHWAKELKFGDAETNTLNYNIRVLGREGFLTMNAIGEMDALPLFNQDVDKILGSVEFNEGYKYGEFNPKMDRVAAYGIGGLVAGKVLAKAGFFAVIAKAWKFIAIGAVGLFGLLRKKFFGAKE